MAAIGSACPRRTLATAHLLSCERGWWPRSLPVLPPAWSHELVRPTLLALLLVLAPVARAQSYLDDEAAAAGLQTQPLNLAGLLPQRSSDPALAVSPDGAQLFSLEQRVHRLELRADGSAHYTGALDGKAPVRAGAVSPDGARLAVGGHGVAVWSPPVPGVEPLRLDGAATDLAWSADGRRLVALAGHTILVWEATAAGFAPVATLHLEDLYVATARLADSGRAVVTVTTDRLLVHRLDRSPPELVLEDRFPKGQLPMTVSPSGDGSVTLMAMATALDAGRDPIGPLVWRVSRLEGLDGPRPVVRHEAPPLPPALANRWRLSPPLSADGRWTVLRGLDRALYLARLGPGGAAVVATTLEGAPGWAERLVLSGDARVVVACYGSGEQLMWRPFEPRRVAIGGTAVDWTLSDVAPVASADLAVVTTLSDPDGKPALVVRVTNRGAVGAEQVRVRVELAQPGAPPGVRPVHVGVVAPGVTVERTLSVEPGARLGRVELDGAWGVGFVPRAAATPEPPLDPALLQQE